MGIAVAESRYGIENQRATQPVETAYKIMQNRGASATTVYRVSEKTAQSAETRYRVEKYIEPETVKVVTP